MPMREDSVLCPWKAPFLAVLNATRVALREVVLTGMSAVRLVLISMTIIGQIGASRTVAPRKVLWKASRLSRCDGHSLDWVPGHRCRPSGGDVTIRDDHDRS